ncbi:MAG: hypothetical protein JW953_15270 [Anaerolineae bacterium]|nr:hypothetical protein [Anaerolineae bacterium]
MPVCRDCHGTGQREVKKEITTRCPDCDGSKVLPDGAECERCNKWGEIGTGEFEIEKQLCKTCWGSGKVTEGSVMTWFLVRAVPAALLLLGGGIAGAWALWSLLDSQLWAAILLIVTFGAWGGLIYYFVGQMPGLGEISAMNWFLVRAVPTTLVAVGAGGPAAWASWAVFANAVVTFLLLIGIFAVWGVLMFFFISNLPE